MRTQWTLHVACDVCLACETDVAIDCATERSLTRSAGQALYAGKPGRAVLACRRYAHDSDALVAHDITGAAHRSAPVAALYRAPIYGQPTGLEMRR